VEQKQFEEKMAAIKGWIGVDLDCTLAYYDGWKGSTHIGDPIPKMVKRVREAIDSGIEVKIVTARVSPGSGIEEVKAQGLAILEWCIKHGMPEITEVTNEKDLAMIELWDDRARQFEKNTGIESIQIISNAIGDALIRERCRADRYERKSEKLEIDINELKDQLRVLERVAANDPV